MAQHDKWTNVEHAKNLRRAAHSLNFEIKQGQEGTEMLTIRAMRLQCDIACALAQLLEEK